MVSPVDELDGFYSERRGRKPRRSSGTPWDGPGDAAGDNGAVIIDSEHGTLFAAASGAAVAGSWVVAAAVAAGPEPTWAHAIALGVAAGTGVSTKAIGPLPSIYAGVGTVVVIAFPHASPIIVPAALLAAALYTVMRRSS